jgi:hypothetical protein
MGNNYEAAFTGKALADLEYYLSQVQDSLTYGEATAKLRNDFWNVLALVKEFPYSHQVLDNRFIKRTDVRRFLFSWLCAYYIVIEEKKMIVVLRVAPSSSIPILPS